MKRPILVISIDYFTRVFQPESIIAVLYYETKYSEISFRIYFFLAPPSVQTQLKDIMNQILNLCDYESLLIC